MKTIECIIRQGDCLNALQHYPDNFFDLIITSPPYADCRAGTYGGIPPDEYVEWFLPRSEQLLRVLKRTGTFILNIKEKVVSGERHTYVIELILALRRQGWFWTEEFIWHKKIVIQVNGLIGSAMRGSDACNLIRHVNSTCIRKRSWCRWVNGLKCD